MTFFGIRSLPRESARRRGLLSRASITTGVVIAATSIALGAEQASAAGPYYFCNTPEAPDPYRTLAANDDCRIAVRTITSVNAYPAYSTTQAVCAAPLYSNDSSAGVDCGYMATGGGSVSFGSGTSVYPRIKAYSGNTASAQFRGRYWTP